MVNPTGYTALDLIGYTDKGTYDPNVYYVKNDLVHYSGNIWRILVDDTIGITPAEGVNYTLFVGEPNNLVERIIAPVEVTPAEHSYAVGRQFIYNDLLYEVISAITAGDNLVTYETDPTNANIKLASPVETQLLEAEEALTTKTVTFALSVGSSTSKKVPGVNSNMVVVACNVADPSKVTSSTIQVTTSDYDGTNNNVVVIATVIAATNITLTFASSKSVTAS